MSERMFKLEVKGKRKVNEKENEEKKKAKNKRKTSSYQKKLAI